MNRTIMAYNFIQKNEDETEISIYDVIASKKSFNWWTEKEGTEVTPTDFKEQLKNCKTKNITIRMNSSGGEVNSANVIAVAIQEAISEGKHIICKIDGMCASAAVQIATVCEEVIIHQSALMMIHNPMALLFDYYDVNAIDKVKNMLKATKDSIISYYMDKTGLSKQKLSNMMDEETFMTGKEAVEKGFADSLMFDDTSEEEVMNNIAQLTVVNQALNIPTQYMSTINTIISKKEGAPKEMEIKTVQDLVKEFPTLTNELVQGAIAEYQQKNPTNNAGEITNAVNAERERMKAIDGLAGKVSDELLNKAKYETFDSAEKVAMEALTTGAFVQSQVLNAMQTETTPAGQVAGAVNSGVADPTADPKKTATEKASSVALNYLKSLGKVE